MTNTPIAMSVSGIRERLLVSLASVREGNGTSAEVMNIVSCLALANEALSRVEIGASSVLLFQARSALQATLRHLLEGTIQVHAAGINVSVLIAESLELLIAVIREHNLVEPEETQLDYEVIERANALAPTVPVPLDEVPAPVVNAEAPKLSGDPVKRVMPFQEALTPMPASPAAAPEMDASQQEVQLPPKAPTVFPRTAVRLQFGSNGLPHIEVELDVHSESNFYTNCLGNICDHGGIFVATWAAAAVGTSCDVMLHFPGDLNAEVRGVVRWRRESKGGESDTVPGLGVEITQADEDAWALIQRFVEKREPIVHDM